MALLYPPHQPDDAPPRDAVGGLLSAGPLSLAASFVAFALPPLVLMVLKNRTPVVHNTAVGFPGFVLFASGFSPALLALIFGAATLMKRRMALGIIAIAVALLGMGWACLVWFLAFFLGM